MPTKCNDGHLFFVSYICRPELIVAVQEHTKEVEADANSVIQRLQGELAEAKEVRDKLEAERESGAQEARKVEEEGRKV